VPAGIGTQAIDEDIHQTQHARLPAWLIVHGAHPYEGAQQIL
jgi:hypothetical protein